ncbi:MAG TPA: hypothetical protein VGF84_20835 [Micromonosporaceae bacterium]
MPFAASLYVVAPLIAFGVIAALAAVLRWAFDGELVRTWRAAGGDADYGLLSVAGVVESDDQADSLQHLLAGVGIRATTAPRPDGRIQILVFPGDLEQARRVVGGSTH